MKKKSKMRIGRTNKVLRGGLADDSRRKAGFSMATKWDDGRVRLQTRPSGGGGGAEPRSRNDPTRAPRTTPVETGGN